MPIYQFKDPKTNEIVEVVQGMNDKHELEVNNVKYERIFTVSNTAVDTKIDPFSAKDFSEKTGRKKGNLNDLFQTSAELSEKRAQKDGVDSLKTQYYEDYSKKRGGKIHGDIAKKNAVDKLNSLGVSVE